VLYFALPEGVSQGIAKHTSFLNRAKESIIRAEHDTADFLARSACGNPKMMSGRRDRNDNLILTTSNNLCYNDTTQLIDEWCVYERPGGTEGMRLCIDTTDQARRRWKERLYVVHGRPILSVDS
jgi:hypothetical protein